MPVQIGVRSHSFSDPTGLLSDCHRRIEMFLKSLERVASVIDRPLTEANRTALDSALRYFREAAPKHTADEEESLFPRLRQIDLHDVVSAIQRLQLLEHDHVLAGSLHAKVEELGQRCLASGSLEFTDAEKFRNAVSTLVTIYTQHITVEDNFIFPLAARLLSSTDKAAIAEEMAARRNLR